jgi:hypothetical protein
MIKKERVLRKDRHNIGNKFEMEKFQVIIIVCIHKRLRKHKKDYHLSIYKIKINNTTFNLKNNMKNI